MLYNIKRYEAYLTFLLTVTPLPLISFTHTYHWRALYSKRKNKFKWHRAKIRLLPKHCRELECFGEQCKIPDLLTSRQVLLSKSVKKTAISLNQPPCVHEVQFQNTDSASHRTAYERSHDWHSMLWAKHRYIQDMQRLDHMLWGHMNSTAHIRVPEKEMKKQVMFPMIYASHSFWLPRQPHHLTPPSSISIKVFLSPPAPLTSSCHYIFFEIPLMRNESPLLANTGLSLFQTCHSLWAMLWGQGATQWIFQQLSPHLPGKKDSHKLIACRKNGEETKEMSFLVELGMGLGTRT